MNNNLKTFPKKGKAGYGTYEVDCWLDDVEAELREHIKADCSSLEAKWLIIDGEAYIKIKEILGE